MKLIVTIDTEEDNWGHFSPTGHTLENIDRIPILQELFDTFNVKPTYLVTYPVASDSKSVALLRGIEKSGKCEIGMHCHPWNTPPFEEENSERNSILCNLFSDLQYKKMSYLHEAIRNAFDIMPVSFRSGRWGYDQSVAKNLYRLGYKIDTSITPYKDWTTDYGPDFSDIPPRPFRFDCEDIYRELPQGHMLEVPVSIGYLQANFELCNKILKMLRKSTFNRLRLIGILDKLNLLNNVWLSPEMSDSKKMIKLARCLMKKDHKILNMFFHSTTLKAGLNDYVKTKDDEKRFLQSIKDFLSFAIDAGIESIRLSDSLSIFVQSK
jgi:hypothetical protein